MATNETFPTNPAVSSKAVERSGVSPMAHIGRSISIKGELSGQEDLIVDGMVEGAIELHDHNLTIEQNARVKAKIHAKNVVILGEVVGEIEALERVEIQPVGRLQGNIFAPRIIIADGAQFKGSVDMPDPEQKGAKEKARPVHAAVAGGSNHPPPVPSLNDLNEETMHGVD